MVKAFTSIKSFTTLYDRMITERPFISSLVTGHLAIEFLLRRLASQHGPAVGQRDPNTMRHHALITLNNQVGIISDAQRDVLTGINSLRNKLAHEISYEPTITELSELWQKAKHAFSDMTDGIEQGIEAFGDATSIMELDDWVIPELFVQICYDLHNEYVDRGGDIEDF